MLLNLKIEREAIIVSTVFIGNVRKFKFFEKFLALFL